MTGGFSDRSGGAYAVERSTRWPKRKPSPRPIPLATSGASDAHRLRMEHPLRPIDEPQPIRLSPQQPLPAWRRAVLKVGSSLLAADGEVSSPRHALGLAQFVSPACAAGREVVIVSSGAVAAGRAVLHRKAAPGAAMAERQALAALGQAQLIGLWQRFFDAPVAQVLLTHDDLRNRRRYLNARATLERTAAAGRAAGDQRERHRRRSTNSSSATTTTWPRWSPRWSTPTLLFIATDIDGFYTANPRIHADARPIERRGGADAGVLRHGGRCRQQLRHRRHAHQAGGGGEGGGGRHRDVPVQRHAMPTRCARWRTVSLRGTRFRRAQNRVAARKHWLRHVPLEAGGIDRRCRRGAAHGREGRLAAAGRRGRGGRRFPPRRHGRGALARRARRAWHRARRQPVLRRRYAPHRRAATRATSKPSSATTTART